MTPPPCEHGRLDVVELVVLNPPTIDPKSARVLVRCECAKCGKKWSSRLSDTMKIGLRAEAQIRNEERERLRGWMLAALRVLEDVADGVGAVVHNEKRTLVRDQARELLQAYQAASQLGDEDLPIEPDYDAMGNPY